MINKLRKKIFWIIQISLSVIIIGVIVLFTSFNYKNTITSSTIFMDRIEGRGEIKDNKPKDYSESKNDRYIEGVYRIDVNNNTASSKIDNVTDEIKKYAIEVSNRKFDEGYIGDYIYKVRKIGMNGKEVTLIESKNTIKGLKITISISIIIGFLGIIIIYVIAKKISKTIVKPVEESFKKQQQYFFLLGNKVSNLPFKSIFRIFKYLEYNESYLSLLVLLELLLFVMYLLLELLLLFK